MKTICGSVLLLLVVTYSSFGGPTGDFAKTGRILTIEQWHSPDGMAWAVQEKQIIIYKMSDCVNGKDVLIAVKPITSEQLKVIRDAILQLPKDAAGFVHDGSLSTHAPMLRLSFTGNGSLDDQRLEIFGYLPPWIEKLVSEVTAISRPEAPILFPEMIAEYRRNFDPKTFRPGVRKISIRRYYR